jgi:hypothetical protein
VSSSSEQTAASKRSSASILLIPDKAGALPKNVLCVGIKTPTETIMLHQEGANRGRNEREAAPE